LIGQPVQAFDEPIAFGRHGSTNVPRTVLYKRQAKLFGQLRFGHSALLILLVGKHQQYRPFQLLLLEQSHEFLPGRPNAIHVGAIHHKNDCVRVRVVAAPVRANVRLAAQIPNRKVQVFVHHGLYVETDRGNRPNHPVGAVEFVQDSCLPSIIESQNQNADLAVAEQRSKYFGE